MALSILRVRVQPALKGKEKKSWVCQVANVNHPTAEDWMEHFIGYDEASKLRVYEAFGLWANFGQIEHEINAQLKIQATKSQSENSVSACDIGSDRANDDDGVIEF